VTSPPVVDTLKVFTASFFRFHFEPTLGTTRLTAVPLISVGKEMPISRIVVAVPNATVVLLD
jgi:hypothetical protein